MIEGKWKRNHLQARWPTKHSGIDVETGEEEPEEEEQRRVTDTFPPRRGWNSETRQGSQPSSREKRLPIEQTFRLDEQFSGDREQRETRPPRVKASGVFACSAFQYRL